MKPILYLLMLLTFAACKKQTFTKPPAQQMQVKELNNVEIGYNSGKRFDIDGNGTLDLAFRTYHIGDPLLQMDKIQFCAVSLIESHLPVNSANDVAVVNNGDWIFTESKPNYEWFEVSLLVMAQKNIPLNGAVYWTGTWRQTNHQYLPVQLLKNGKRYNGWVELSFDMEREKIILHRSAICTVANLDIKAGS